MYKITASELNNEKATEYETKSMLYLMNYYNNRGDVAFFAIDFFNDVTGIDRYARNLYDVQSKGIKDIQPATLGCFLVTLFKNYLSDLNFLDFILFIESVSVSIKKEIGEKTVFKYSDLSVSAQKSIKESLLKESMEKTYIEDKSLITDEKLNDFLVKVNFVIGNKNTAQYIRDLIKVETDLNIEDSYLKKIFKEIRDCQSSKKNNAVENKIIEKIGDVFAFDKTIDISEIKILVLNRIISKHGTKFDKAMPSCFSSIYMSVDETVRDDFLEECQDAVFKILLNKGNSDAYWILFGEVFTLIKNNPNDDVDSLYQKIKEKTLNDVTFLDYNSARYFVAMVKEGIKK